MVAENILRQGVVGISEIAIKTGLVNFAYVHDVLKDADTVLMGVGVGFGRNRAADAAITFPISEANRIVFNVGGSDLGLSEINAASDLRECG